MPKRRISPTDETTQAILAHWRDAVPKDRLAHLVRDAARGLTRALQRRLAEHGVSFGHWTFLRVLWDADGLTQRELSLRAGVMEPTTHSALQALEKMGLVTRRQSAEGRRRTLILLTPQGRALKHRLVPQAEQVNAIAAYGVAPTDLAATRRTLLAMVQNLARDEIEAAGQDRHVPSTREVSRRIEAGPPRRRRVG